MKEKIITLLFLSFAFISFAQSNYYYYFDQKIYLDPVSNKYTVEFINSVDESVFTSNNFAFIHLKNKMYEVSGDYISLLSSSNGTYNINQLYTFHGENKYMKNEISLRYKDNV
jgi:hypothetical protein